MAKRKVYIQTREFIPDVAEILGLNEIDVEYEFAKAEIRGDAVCVFETEVSAEQAAEIDRRAKLRREKKV